MRRIPLLTMVVLVLCAAAPSAHATEEYASVTRQPCSHCHESPSGGGELTAAGTAFRAAVLAPRQRAPSLQVRFLFGAVLFLHIAAAFVWFGTILYVHIILKPAYAVRGLPKGELRIGQAGVLLIAATGILLTLHRVHSWHALLNTRFGVLLAVKIALFLIMATTAIVVSVFIRPRLGRRDGRAQAGGQEFTPQDLSSFDGQEDQPTYVAYQEKVFDLSQSHAWQGGVHMRRHRAGTDLTEVLPQAPHGPERLAAFPVLGRLVSAKAVRPLYERTFYILAYMNLGIIAAVLLVIALWRS